MAYSEDWVHIVIAKMFNSIITVFGCLSGLLKQTIDIGMGVLEIKVVNNTIFALSQDELICWNLEAGGMVDNTHSIRRVTFN